MAAKLELAVDAGRWDAGIKKAQSSLDNFVKSQGGMSNALKQSNDKMTQFVKMMGDMDSKAKTARGAFNDYKASVEQLSHSYAQMTAKEKQSTFGKETIKSIEKLKQKMKEAHAEMNSFGNGNLSTGSGFNIGALASIAGPIGVATSAAAAFGAVIVSNINTAKNFEQAEANLASVLGTTRDNIVALRDDALRLGASTQYTASEVAGLQTELAKLGFSQKEIVNSTEGILSFATATGSDLASAASLAGAALRAFGYDSSEMDRVVSTLAVGTTKSALSFEYLQTAISTIAPVAKAAGYQIEDVTALLGMLANSGFDASSAATATRNIMLKLADSNSDLSRELGKPIKSLDDLAEGLKELKNQGIDLGKMFEITDARAVAAFATFVDGSNKLQELRDSVTGVNDELKAMVDERANTLQGALNSLSSAWEGLNLSINGSNSALKPFVEKITEGVTGATELVTAFKNLSSELSNFVGTDVSSTFDNVDFLSLGILGPSYKLWELIVEKAKEYNQEVNRGESLKSIIDSAMDSYFPTQSTTDKVEQVDKKVGNSIKKQEKKIKELKKKWEEASDQSIRDKYKKEIELANAELDRMIGKLNDAINKQKKQFALENAKVAAAEKKQENAQLDSFTTPKLLGDIGQVFPEGSLGALNQELAAANAALQEAVIGSKEWEDAMSWIKDVKTRLPKEGKDAAAAWSAAGTAMHGVGSALASMDDPSAKILGLIAQGIASVASGAGQAIAAKDTTASGWAWIGAAAAITSEMVAIISTMKSATQYHADGGFVTPSGMARGTDTVGPVMLTPGELVLNRAQQTNLANQLGEPNQRQQVEFRIKDRELVGIIGNYYNRQSKVL